MATPEVHRATAEALLSASATHHLTSAQRLATLAEAQVHATLATIPAPADWQVRYDEMVARAAHPIDAIADLGSDDPAEALVKAPRPRRTSAKAAGK